MADIKAYLNSSTQKAACSIGEFIDKYDKTDHVHYGCGWQIREDGIYHVCNEQKRTWKVSTIARQRKNTGNPG